MTDRDVLDRLRTAAAERRAACRWMADVYGRYSPERPASRFAYEAAAKRGLPGCTGTAPRSCAR